MNKSYILYIYNYCLNKFFKWLFKKCNYVTYWEVQKQRPKKDCFQQDKA